MWECPCAIALACLLVCVFVVYVHAFVCLFVRLHPRVSVNDVLKSANNSPVT